MLTPFNSAPLAGTRESIKNQSICLESTEQNHTPEENDGKNVPTYTVTGPPFYLRYNRIPYGNKKTQRLG